MGYQSTLIWTLLMLMISIADLKGAIMDTDGLGHSQHLKHGGKGAWELVISPLPEFETKVLIKRTDETLNLTCKIQRTSLWLVTENDSSITPPIDQQFNLAWYVPISLENSKNRVINNVHRDSLELIVQNLRETDTGEYKCTAKEAIDNPDTHLFSGSLNVQVKPKRGLVSKLQEACDKFIDVNCSRVHSPCCNQNQLPSIQLSLDVSQYATNHHQQYNEIGYLQTTIYTVIGCAMAFMFVITIIVIAICRVHLKRGAMVRYPPPLLRRPTTFPQDPDSWGNVLMDAANAPGGGVLVTYNVSEGLHLLGHPSNPPPYDEIVQVPPTQGPPPPYSSLDNLHMISAEPPPPPLGLGTRQLILTFLNENATQTQREAQGDWEEPETRVPLLDEPNAGTCGPTPLTPPPPAVSSMEEI